MLRRRIATVASLGLLASSCGGDGPGLTLPPPPPPSAAATVVFESNGPDTLTARSWVMHARLRFQNGEIPGSLQLLVDGAARTYQRRPYSQTSLETHNADGSISLELFANDTITPGTHRFELRFVDTSGHFASVVTTKTFLPLPQVAYRIRRLGDPPSGEGNVADIDDDGTVGGWITLPDQSATAAIWRASGLTVFPHETNVDTRILALSGDVIVGRKQLNFNGRHLPVQWNGSTWVDLPAGASMQSLGIMDVNRAGQILITNDLSDGTSLVDHGTITKLAFRGTSLNERGETAGYVTAGNELTSSASARATFSFAAPAALPEFAGSLNVLPTGTSTNARGDILGLSGTTRWFFTPRGGSPLDLLGPLGGTETFPAPIDMNDSSVVVARMGAIGGIYLWSPKRGPAVMQVDQSQYAIEQIVAVNNAGLMAARVRDRAGHRGAAILEPVGAAFATSASRSAEFPE